MANKTRTEVIKKRMVTETLDFVRLGWPSPGQITEEIAAQVDMTDDEFFKLEDEVSTYLEKLLAAIEKVRP